MNLVQNIHPWYSVWRNLFCRMWTENNKMINKPIPKEEEYFNKHYWASIIRKLINENIYKVCNLIKYC